MSDRACPLCGVKKISNGGKFCSNKCKFESQQKRVKLACCGCGNEFEIKPYLQRKNNYCSVNCYRNSTNKKIIKICPVCGKGFEVRAYLVKMGFGIYCSKQCLEFIYKSKRKNNNCRYCGKKFSRAISLSNKYVNTFCHKECHDSFMRDYVLITCLNCHKDISIPRSVINRGKGRFCSWYCYNHHKGETSIEKLVKDKLDNAKIPYQQEVKIGRYHADFMIGNSKVIIECDGDYWHCLPLAVIKDKKRDSILRMKGYQIIRFTENEIKKTKGDCVILRLKEKSIGQLVRRIS